MNSAWTPLFAQQYVFHTQSHLLLPSQVTKLSSVRSFNAIATIVLYCRLYLVSKQFRALQTVTPICPPPDNEHTFVTLSSLSGVAGGLVTTRTPKSRS